MTDERRISECPFGIHEALHIAHVSVCFFYEQVASHPAVALRPELKKQADKIIEDMADLYQAIGNIRRKDS